MKKLILISSVLILLVAAGCKKSRCWKGYGNDATDDRKVESFHTIEIYNNLNMIFHTDTAFRVRIEATDNLIPFINTDVSDGVLTLSDDNRCDFVRGYDRDRTVHVWAPTIEHVLCYNSGQVLLADTVHTNYFTFEHWTASGSNEIKVNADTVDLKLHTGTGDITAHGSGKHLFLYASSYGFSDCDNLKVESAWVTVRSTGDAFVNVSNRLRTFTHSRADIFVQGNPTNVTSEGDGTGEVIFE